MLKQGEGQKQILDKLNELIGEVKRSSLDVRETVARANEVGDAFAQNDLEQKPVHSRNVIFDASETHILGVNEIEVQFKTLSIYYEPQDEENHDLRIDIVPGLNNQNNAPVRMMPGDVFNFKTPIAGFLIQNKLTANAKIKLVVLSDSNFESSSMRIENLTLTAQNQINPGQGTNFFSNPYTDFDSNPPYTIHSQHVTPVPNFGMADGLNKFNVFEYRNTDSNLDENDESTWAKKLKTGIPGHDILHDLLLFPFNFFRIQNAPPEQRTNVLNRLYIRGVYLYPWLSTTKISAHNYFPGLYRPYPPSVEDGDNVGDGFVNDYINFRCSLAMIRNKLSFQNINSIEETEYLTLLDTVPLYQHSEGYKFPEGVTPGGVYIRINNPYWFLINLRLSITQLIIFQCDLAREHLISTDGSSRVDYSIAIDYDFLNTPATRESYTTPEVMKKLTGYEI